MTPKYQTRTILIDCDARRDLAIAAVQNAPPGVEVVIRLPVKRRKLDQNALMWTGPLKDLAEQAWVQGRQFSAETWHEYLKREYLPEDDDPDLERLVLAGYRKWDVTPGGDRVLVGSTTKLSVRGMAEYLEKIYAFGASLGVMLRAMERQ